MASFLEPQPDTQEASAAKLRRRAEQRLAPPPEAHELSAAEAKYLVHELQVHQAELLIQNESLRQLEAESREALQHLIERTAELVIEREAAEAANRAKSAFLANMSHELRTPLNGMMGMTHLALKRATDPVQIDKLNKAMRASEQLLSVINDVLEISRIEADKMELAQKEFQLGGVFERLTNSLSPQVAQKGLGFKVVIAPELASRLLVGDAQHLEQVLVRLAGNAVKFTEAGTVRVAARVEQELEDGALVRFEVEDPGVGIAQENTARLFRSFEQIDASSTRRHGGMGLGLAICKRLVQMMHGEIGVQSRLGLGSTFWFTARLGAGQATHQEVLAPPLTDAREQLRREFAQSSVLLVEDNPINQEVICALLEDADLKVTVAHNGASALALCRYVDHALVLMDLQLPVLDGIQATRGIRQISGREHTPIIALTVSAFVQDRNACLDAGMSDHLAKPVEPAALYGTLLKWLRSKPTMPRV